MNLVPMKAVDDENDEDEISMSKNTSLLYILSLILSEYIWYAWIN